jgi:hypothetical protein
MHKVDCLRSFGWPRQQAARVVDYAVLDPALRRGPGRSVPVRAC